MVLRELVLVEEFRTYEKKLDKIAAQPVLS